MQSSPPQDFLADVRPRTRLISVNQLKTWSRCRKKYFLDYVNNLHWPTDQSNFRFGQDVHKLLDYHSRDLDCAAILEHSPADVQEAWDLLMASAIPRQPVVASEWGFHVPMEANGRHWLVGRIDRLSMEEGRLLVIDWKTGTAVPKTPETDWQTLVYLYAAFEARHEFGLDALVPEDLEFVYVEVRDTIREIRVPYSRKRHEEIRELLEKTIREMVGAEEYSLPGECPDKWCPYPAICGIRETFRTGGESMQSG